MTIRLRILVSGCAIALVLASMPFVRSVLNPEQAPVTSPVHGYFGARLQPALEGIGSTKELPAVPLDAAKPNDATGALSGAAKSQAP